MINDDELTGRTLNGIEDDQLWIPNRRFASIRIPDLEDRFNRIKNIVVPKTTTTVTVPAGTPAQVTGVSATESPFKTQDGSVKSNVSVSFTASPSDTYFDHAQVWFTGYNGSTNPQLMSDGRTSPISFLCDTTHETVTVTVVAVGSTGISADFTFAPTTTVLLDGVTSAPPAPSISQSLVQTPTGYQFAFNQLSGLAADQIAGYRIWQNTANNSSTATQIDYVAHNPQNNTPVVLQYTAANGVTNFYWVSSVNTTGLESSKTAAQSGTVTSANPVDSSNIIVATGLDFTRAYTNKQLDNIADGATYGRPLLSRLSSGKPWIDFSEGIHANKILDNIGDGTTYARTKGTYLVSGVPYNNKGAWSSITAYVKGDEVQSGGNYWLCLVGNTNSAPAIGNANWQLLGPTNLDNLTDGSTYGRVVSSDLTSHRLDFSKSLLNKQLDNIPDGTTFKRLANVASDNTLHVSTPMNQQASILPGQAILMTYQIPSTSVIIGTWNQQTMTRPDASTITLTASAGPSLITNGNMESGTLGSAEPNWTVSFNGTLVTANDNVHGGSFSGKEAGGTNTLNGQAINVTGGQVYVVEGWIKCDAMPTSSGHGAWFQVAINGGVTAFTKVATFMPTDGTDSSSSTAIEIGYAANGAAHGWGFFQCYFIPNANGQVIFYCQNICISGNAWFDDCNFYAHNGVCYTGLTAGQSYYIYPYIGVSGNTGTMAFTNSNPPNTSPSDILALQCGYDGRISVGVAKITMPTSGGGGSVSGGGSGSCPEYYQPVFVRRYDDTGNLIFDGQMYAGDVQLGFDPDENHAFPRGDFLKGYSFTQQADVYRAVTFTQVVPCGGWMIVNGYKVTACETVYVNSQWTPAWKAAGAVHDSVAGMKVQIQVKADADDEHNYYVGTLLIHNYIPAS